MKREQVRTKMVFAGVSAFLMALAILFAGALNNAHASGITVYKDGDKYVKIGGRIQLQYHYMNSKTATSDPAGEDKIFFRRLRPFIEGSVLKNWKGKFQWDMGDAVGDNEMAIKDAYIGYSGPHNIKIEFGNAYFRFSQEDLTSSKKQQLVERTFAGDHNYGSPERNAGLHLTGAFLDKKLTYGFSAAIASVDPDSKKLDFDTPVNRNADFNEGYMAGARVSYHPFGHLKMSQGDLGKGGLKAVVNLASFVWQNDDDNNTYTNASGFDTSSGKKFDVESVVGFEVSAAARFQGASVDAEFNSFNAETVDRTATGGLYQNGSTTLQNIAIEGGYMVLAKRLELVAGFQRQDADNYAKKWKRTSIGANYFVKGHNLKAQVTYRIGENLDGIDGKDENEVFVQAQFVF
ncbi:MAG: porin, partial [Thermodesulfobacteriota bacterium]